MGNMCVAVVVMVILYGAVFVGAWKSELKVRIKSTTKFEKVGLMLTGGILFAAAIITIARNSDMAVEPTGYILGGFSDFMGAVLASNSSLILLAYFIIMPLPAMYLLAFSFRSLVEKRVKSSVPMFLLMLIGVVCISVYDVSGWKVADLFILLLLAIILFIYSSGVIARLSKKCKLLLVLFVVVMVAVAAFNLVIPFKSIVLVAEYAIAAMLIGWIWKKLRYFRKIWKAVAIIFVLALVVLGQCLLFV